MQLWLQILVTTLAELVAPFFVAYYVIRGVAIPEWLGTPDDTVSPYGQYEPRVKWVYERLGKKVGDFYWLGLRNRAYGLKYKFKPDTLKYCDNYNWLLASKKQIGPLRIITVGTYKEYMLSLGLLHVIVGYRLRPILDRIDTTHTLKHPNMDSRPIFSIRGGGKDD